MDVGHNADSHHVFSAMLMEAGLALNPDLASGSIPRAPGLFVSRIPPLLDRPPLARA